MTLDEIDLLIDQLSDDERKLAKSRIDDPVLYSRYALGEDPWEMQQRIMRSVVENPWTSVKACHSSSKTRTAADLVLWWLARYGECLVLTTAPGERQVKGLLWREIHHLISRPSPLGMRLYPDPVGTELRIHDKSFATGFVARIDATDEGVRYQGPHSEHTLIIVDEAPGVHSKAYEAFQGIMASGHCRLLELGNPTITGGPFYESHTARRSTRACFTISAFQTPNLVKLGIDPRARTADAVQALLGASGDALEAMTVRPYLVSPRWVRDRWYEWGAVGSPLWDARVLGEFPQQAEDALIWLTWIETARREAPQKAGVHYRVGVDVADVGDSETVAVVTDDQGRFTAMGCWIDPDPRGKCVAFLQPYRDRIEYCNVDAIGTGRNFGLHLRDQGIPHIQLVNVAESPLPIERDAATKYINLKAQAYWGLRDEFRPPDGQQIGALHGIEDEALISQLATLRYDYDSRGRIRIEKKEDARKRGVKSPDRAEALMLARLKYRKFRQNQSRIRVL